MLYVCESRHSFRRVRVIIKRDEFECTYPHSSHVFYSFSIAILRLFNKRCSVFVGIFEEVEI